jgi:hypothetical protein
MKKATRNPVLVLIAFWTVFLLLSRLPSDGWVRSIPLFLVLAVVMSVVVVVKMIRHRSWTAYSHYDSLPRRIRRWVTDEHDTEERQH